MKKIIFLSLATLTLFSCKKEENNSLESLLNSKNAKALQEKKASLQADITKIDEVLNTLEVKKDRVQHPVNNHQRRVARQIRERVKNPPCVANSRIPV